MVFDAFLRLRLRSKPDNAVDNRADIAHSSDWPGNRPQERRRQGTGEIALLSISDLPPWRDPNPYILTGYRRQSRSVAASFASWLYWHNESCNIYSHLLPGLFLLLGQGALYDHVRTRHWDLDSFDASVLSLQVLTAVFCFLISAAYHTLIDHSAEFAQRWLQLDYVGIIALILGNFISGLHFGFYCTPLLKYFYWALVRLLSSLAGGRLTGTSRLANRYRSSSLAAPRARSSSFLNSGAPNGARSVWGAFSGPACLRLRPSATPVCSGVCRTRRGSVCRITC